MERKVIKDRRFILVIFQTNLNRATLRVNTSKHIVIKEYEDQEHEMGAKY